MHLYSETQTWNGTYVFTNDCLGALTEPTEIPGFACMFHVSYSMMNKALENTLALFFDLNESCTPCRIPSMQCGKGHIAPVPRWTCVASVAAYCLSRAVDVFCFSEAFCCSWCRCRIVVSQPSSMLGSRSQMLPKPYLR